MTLVAVALGKTNGSVSQTVETHTTTGDVAIGDLIIVGLVGNNTASTFNTVTDSASNTYQSIAEGNGNSMVADMFFSVATAAMATGGTLTVTSSAARITAIEAMAFSPPAGTTATVKDVEATPFITASSVTPWVTNAAPTTSQPSELSITLWGSGGASTVTATGGWTQSPDGVFATVGTVRRGFLQYLELTSVGTPTGEATPNAANGYIGLQAVFKLFVDLPPAPDGVYRYTRMRGARF
jgi:hypothetical protein